MEHLVTPQEIVKLGRPIGQVSDDKLNAYITEAEQLYIKPILGTSLFLRLLSDDSDEKIHTLLEGGIYEDEKGETQSLLGLKVTLSYFVYAQNVMSGDFQSTRFGMRLKEDNYSSGISSKERSDCYNNTLEIANSYLRECVSYCKSVGLIKRPGRPCTSFGGITIRKIGK